MTTENEKAVEFLPKILVFSTDKISDPGIDLAGLLKIHYPPSVYTIILPCSSSVKPGWIMHAFRKGIDGVFIAADGTDCPCNPNCPQLTANVMQTAQDKMKAEGINPARLKMAAVCSVCAEPFANHMKTFYNELVEMGSVNKPTGDQP